MGKRGASRGISSSRWARRLAPEARCPSPPGSKVTHVSFPSLAARPVLCANASQPCRAAPALHTVAGRSWGAPPALHTVVGRSCGARPVVRTIADAPSRAPLALRTVAWPSCGAPTAFLAVGALPGPRLGGSRCAPIAHPKVGRDLVFGARRRVSVPRIVDPRGARSARGVKPDEC